jgi:hypothetical protein
VLGPDGGVRALIGVGDWLIKCEGESTSQRNGPEGRPRPHSPPGRRGSAKPKKRDLRRRAEAIVAEFGGLLPEPTDAGLAEAESRLSGLRRAYKALHADIPWDIAAENEIIIPILGAAEEALIDFITDTTPQGFVGAAIKLREMLIDHSAQPEAEQLESILALIKREVGS